MMTQRREQGMLKGKFNLYVHAIIWQGMMSGSAESTAAAVATKQQQLAEFLAI